MVKSASGKEKRSFTVVDARRVDGCPTKFKVKGDSGRYISNDARGASKKAFTTLCRIKKIRGQCALLITMRETTQGSAGKELTYKLRRVKLEEPIVLGDRTYEYETVVKAVKGDKGLTCKSGKGKSSGPMKAKKSKKMVSNKSKVLDFGEGPVKQNNYSSKVWKNAVKSLKAKKTKKVNNVSKAKKTKGVNKTQEKKGFFGLF